MATIETINNERPVTARPKINNNFAALNTELAEKETPAAAQSKADAAVSTHNSDAAAHADIRTEVGTKETPAGAQSKVDTAVSTHNADAAAHADIRTEVAAKETPAGAQTKADAAVADHVAAADPHPQYTTGPEVDQKIADAGTGTGLTSEQVDTKITTHNTDGAAHSDIRDAIALKKDALVTAIDLAGGTVLQVGKEHKDTLAVGKTYSFDRVLNEGEGASHYVDATAEIVIAFPQSKRVGSDDLVSAVTLLAGTSHEFHWEVKNGVLTLIDSTGAADNADLEARVTAVETEISSVSTELTATTTSVAVLEDQKENRALALRQSAGLTNTMLAGDVKNGMVEISHDVANNFVIPTNATLPLPDGSRLLIVQTGAGVTSIVPEDGTVTILAYGGITSLLGRYSQAFLVKRSANIWFVFIPGATGGTDPGAPPAPSGFTTFALDDFETGLKPSGWVTTHGTEPSADLLWDATSSGMGNGTYALYISGSIHRVRRDFTAVGAVEMYFRWKVDVGGGTPYIISLFHGTTESWIIRAQANGSIRVTGPGGTWVGDSASGLLTGATMYHFWIQAAKGTGSDGVLNIRMSTDGVRPASTIFNKTNLAMVDDIAAYGIRTGVSGYACLWDLIKVGDTPWGDNGADPA